MTGLAPISDATPVGANSASAASSGVQAAGSQRPADFSSVLNSTANTPRTTQGETPGKSVPTAQTNSTHSQKTQTTQTNSQANPQAPAAPARVNVPAAVPVLISSALTAGASTPIPPPVLTATSASPNLKSAESGSTPVANAAVAAEATEAATAPEPAAKPTPTRMATPTPMPVAAPDVQLVDATESEIASAEPPATTVGTDDLSTAQTETSQIGSISGDVNNPVNAAGDSSAAQPMINAEQNAPLAARPEIVATILSAVAIAAAGNRAPMDPAPSVASQSGSWLQDPAQRHSETSTSTSAAASTDKPATTPELAPKLVPLQTVLPAQLPATNEAPSVQSGAHNHETAQSSAAETSLPANGAAANFSLQKAISDAHDKLVQAIDANLQAEISAAPTKAIGPANPANGGGENAAGQNPQNPSFNSSAQDLLQQCGDAAAGIAPIPSGNASEMVALSASSSPSTVVKTAGLPGPATDASLRIVPDASQLATNAPTTPTPPPTGGAGASTPRPGPPLPSPLPPALPQSLNDVAKASELYQRVGGSEMHVAMETDLLGAVDLRATMHQSALTATIGVQRADVQALLSNELPALQHALAEKNFHVEQISVLNNSVGGRAGSSGQQDAPAQSQNPFAPRAAYAPIAAELGATAGSAEDLRAITSASAMAHAWSDDGGRISVHV
jgi:flagellar hook-length control protein FliK